MICMFFYICSPPFELCVNITSPDGEHVMECLTPTSNSSCTFPLQYHLRHWGNYTLDVVARNDVSKVRHKFVVKVTQSGRYSGILEID